MMIVIITAIIILIIDQITKYIITANMSLGETIPVIQNIFHITYITNTGVAFGLFSGLNFLFVIFSVIFVGVLFVFYKTITTQYASLKTSYIFNISYGLLLGGAIGNFIDRIFRGSVVDFFDFRIWPVFNIADSCITVSAFVIAIYIWYISKKMQVRR